MPTFKINESRVKVTDDMGSSLSIDASHINYDEACDAALSANWPLFRELALEDVDAPELDDEPMIGMVCGISIEDMADQIQSATGIDILEREEDEPDENDLSNWNGSPIYYPTREMARSQVNRWGMFWAYHDFGIAAPTGYRYATVPLGVGPTAPDGYDWVCLPREE